jgi:DNA repair protein RecO (recombination protein O)
MQHILKTEAIVLKKMNFGDTSLIATFFTRDFGRLSGIIKGARNPKSKSGSIIDPFNHLQIVLYKKENRELQYISQASLITFFGNLREDYNKIKYASSVLEIVDKLVLDGQEHEIVFRGLCRILTLLDSSTQPPDLLLLRFIMFFIKEAGYELQMEHCSACRKEIKSIDRKYFNLERGMLCGSCVQGHMHTYEFSQELFNLLYCLNSRKNEIQYIADDVQNALSFTESYIKYHVPEFKGISSLRLM